MLIDLSDLSLFDSSGVEQCPPQHFRFGRRYSQSGHEHPSLAPPAGVCGVKAVAAQLRDFDDCPIAIRQLHGSEPLR